MTCRAPEQQIRAGDIGISLEIHPVAYKEDLFVVRDAWGRLKSACLAPSASANEHLDRQQRLLKPCIYL